MGITPVERKAFERVCDESEKAAARCLEGLYKGGWILTSVPKSIYFERVTWYGHTPHDCRMAIAELESGDKVLIWITDPEDGPWRTPRATIFKGRERGREIKQLFLYSQHPPVWAENREHSQTPITKILEDHIGKKRFKKFIERLKPSRKEYKTRLIKETSLYFGEPGTGSDESWTGSVLRIFVPDSLLQRQLEVSYRHPYSSMTHDPLIRSLLDIRVGVYGVQTHMHSVDIALDDQAPLEEVKEAVFAVLNRFGI